MKNLEEKFAEIFHPYRTFTVLALFFLIGVLSASFFELDFLHVWPILLWVSSALLFVAFINFCLKNHYLVVFSFGFIFLVMGVATYSGFDSYHHVNLPYGTEVEFVGRIDNRPRIDFKSQKVIVEVSELGGAKNFKLQLTLSRFPEYHYGDLLKIDGVITQPQNFTDFDYRGYLKRYLVYGLVNQPESVTYLGEENNLAGKITKSLYLASSIFESSLNALLPEPHASLAAGILLGVKRNIPSSLMDQLNATGLTHIIALSGYNVTIIVAIFSGLFLTRLGRRKVFIWGTLLIFFFVLMTGASASVTRAAIFSFLILFGTILGRKADQTNLMLLAATLMVANNPFVLRYDTGFQLSFLAFAGLIYLSPRIKILFDKINLKYFSDGIKFVLAETLGAQIAVFPLIWFQFGRVSLIAPLSNLLVIPTIPLAMGLIFIAGILNLVWAPLGKIGLVLLWPILEYIIKIVGFLSHLPWASISSK